MKKEKKPTRKRHDKRDLARIMFVTSELTAVQVATALSLSPKTVGDWRKEDQWDDERSIRNVSPIALIKRFNSEIERILDRLDTVDKESGKRLAMSPADADMIKKLTKSIKELRNSIDPQTVMEVLNGFVAWLSQADLPLAQQLAGKAILYVQVKMKEQKDK